MLCCLQIRYIHATTRFILTQQPLHSAELLTILKELLHPDDLFLLTNTFGQLVFEEFSLSKGTIRSNMQELDNHITIVKKGVVGVSHRMNDLVNWSHFYTAGDLLFNLEIHEELNQMETKWHILEDTEMYSIDTNVPDKDPLKKLMVAFKLQRSLLCSYQYQHYINNHGLDRHEYSVNWIKSNRKVAAALPRKELANFLGISNSSLKTYLNEAMEDA
ncbi:MAG: hypothetical protein HN571_02925 [Bacteroidetes bacterium]|jgi:hypothetical protein|nr:hypothetical protein [Bacteroidota bacterium]